MEDEKWSKFVVVRHPWSCWTWIGTINHHGYGRIRIGKKTGLAHRVIYETLIGPISSQLQSDHLCRNRSCVNPGHIEPVTGLTNSRRGIIGSRTACSNGHPLILSSSNVYMEGTKRRCKACIRNRQIKTKNAVKAAERIPMPTRSVLSRLLDRDRNWTRIGLQFGVTDNAVRKWARRYELI